MSSAANNWKGHIEGLLNLVSLHPPEAFSHTGAHEIFIETRFDGVTSALSNRKAIFLSQPEWMTGPWRNRQKDAIDFAVDVLVKLPDVLEEWDLLSTRGITDETLQRAKVLKEHCSSLETELQVWYSNFVTSFEKAYPHNAEFIRKGLNDLTQQANIPDILASLDLHHLHAMTIYWTSCTILHATIDLVKYSFPAVANNSTREPSATGGTVLKYLICLARSANYFLKSELGLLGTMSMRYTGTCLVRTLHAHQIRYPEADAEDLKQLRDAMGFLRSLAGYDAWKTWKCGMDDLNYNKNGTYPSHLCH
ncbi:hypothetical protein SLS60_006923 [Paraconiothyrium brasiliense]|uniref:Uncharacterized protein n=1 Tax=Paraconiothyrium brasiliense TaxID=300254 RepID=A0ABR3R995_9PLEO